MSSQWELVGEQNHSIKAIGNFITWSFEMSYYGFVEDNFINFLEILDSSLQPFLVLKSIIHIEAHGVEHTLRMMVCIL